ncbi:uncharacterized protein LOC134009934 isoform X2 [Osmerus eperlanus]|uniref:uncharacterized protein LOC134009934 isoform X2 n=1 Tax=Osmerus eperlanus TaxID=29151 RepID=UPI002E0F6FBB
MMFWAYLGVVVLFKICNVHNQDIIAQPIPLLLVYLGDNVTLQCLYTNYIKYLSWYKQTTGQEHQLISHQYTYSSNILYGEFENNPRFSVQLDKGIYHLQINNTQPSDSAMYFCGRSTLSTVTFEDTGTLLVFRDFKSMSIVQQPVSESIQPGDSVILNCTIQSETCPGEHSVYWFRHGSGESRPGIIYTHGGKSDQCEKSPEAGSPTQSCVYNLPKMNLSLSDAGTYYCAVASCGEILFGNGTKLDIKSCGEDQMRILVLLSIMRTGVLLCCLFIVIIFCFIKKSI